MCKCLQTSKGEGGKEEMRGIGGGRREEEEEGGGGGVEACEEVG